MAKEATAVAEAAFENAASAEPFSVLTSPQPAFDCEATTHEAMNEAMSGECDTERMMRTMKEELIWTNEFESFEQLKLALDAWVKDYNANY